MARLTPNQTRFALEYAADRNGVQAYIRAFGHTKANGVRRSYKAARTEAGRLLANPDIQTEIRAASRAAARRCRVTADRVLRELAAVAFFDPLDAFAADPANGNLPVPRPLADMDPTARRAVASVKVKRRRLAGHGDEVYEVEDVEYRFADKLAALEKLCRHLGLYAADGAIAQLLAALPQGVAAALPPARALVGGDADPGAI